MIPVGEYPRYNQSTSTPAKRRLLSTIVIKARSLPHNALRVDHRLAWQQNSIYPQLQHKVIYSRGLADRIYTIEALLDNPKSLHTKSLHQLYIQEPDTSMSRTK